MGHQQVETEDWRGRSGTMTTLERLDALIERGVFYECDWETLIAVRDELAKRGNDDE